MDKVERPRGLIRYDTTHNQEARLEGKPESSHVLRPRTFWYVSILSFVGLVMLYGLLNRSASELHVLHDRNPLYVTLSDGSIRNGYDIRILNKTHEGMVFSLTVDGLEGADLRVQAAGDPSADALLVYADSVGHFRVFVTAPKPGAARSKLTFTATTHDETISETYSGLFLSAGR